LSALATGSSSFFPTEFMSSASFVGGFATLTASGSSFLTGEFMCGAFCVSGFSAHAGNLALFFTVHCGKTAFGAIRF
jgi:hypothetical protein